MGSQTQFTFQMVFRTTTKFFSSIPCLNANVVQICHANPWSTFRVILYTNKQTTRQTQAKTQPHRRWTYIPSLIPTLPPIKFDCRVVSDQYPKTQSAQQAWPWHDSGILHTCDRAPLATLIISKHPRGRICNPDNRWAPSRPLAASEGMWLSSVWASITLIDLNLNLNEIVHLMCKLASPCTNPEVIFD